MKYEKSKEKINQIKKGQLWKSRSKGLAKGNVVKITGRGKKGFWKTHRTDNEAPKRAPTHAIRHWDLIKYYEKIEQ